MKTMFGFTLEASFSTFLLHEEIATIKNKKQILIFMFHV
ncbi:hypothetical protein JCM19300_3125 [Algibacter lectus]|uniref:Uncharacterized protein n=1 Tax=Algibacter lectus TaxID=221126 RepID=A0A090VJ54_9FLAO|nr:hypothetical protein JCM19300_3125 [Algibacter lectus]